MENKSKKVIIYVVFYLSIFLGSYMPIIIAQYFWRGPKINKEHILLCSLPFIIVMIFILFFKKRNININGSLNNNQQENVLTDSMTINLLKVFFGGLGAGSLLTFIFIVFKYYLKL